MDNYMLGLGPWEGRNKFNYDQEDYALYGEVTRPLGEHLELSAGLRLQSMRDVIARAIQFQERDAIRTLKNGCFLGEACGGAFQELREHLNRRTSIWPRRHRQCGESTMPPPRACSSVATRIAPTPVLTWSIIWTTWPAALLCSSTARAISRMRARPVVFRF